MKNKILGLFVLSFLALTFVVGAVSASFTPPVNNGFIISNIVVPSPVSQDDASFTITFDLKNNLSIPHTVDWFSASTITGGNASYSFSPVNGTSVANGSTVPVTITVSKSILFNGVISGSIVATPDGPLPSTLTFSVNVTPSLKPQKVLDCITTTNQGNNLAATIDDVSIESGYGNSDEWYPLDTVKVRVNVENNGNEKIKTIKVNWGLYNVDTGKFVVQGSESTFDLKDGDNQNVNFQFKLDNVKKLNDNNYKFYTWTTAKDQEFLNTNSGNTCAVDSQDITPQIDSDFVVLDNIQTPDTVQCTQDAMITADIWNIGSEDQTDVYALANSKILGLNEQKVVIGDINSLEKTGLSFSVKVPAGLDEGTYPVRFTLYDRHDNVFENNKNDKAVFDALVNVKGNCFPVGKASVTAGLQSDAVEGKSLVIKSVVTNSGTKSAQFIVSPEGYSAWASSATVDTPAFSLDAGQSKEVTITLQAKQGSMGEQTFDVKVLSGNQVVMTQPVSVLVSRAGFISALTGGAIGGTSSLWIVGALNVILVFAIIIIAIRFFRK